MARPTRKVTKGQQEAFVEASKEMQYLDREVRQGRGVSKDSAEKRKKEIVRTLTKMGLM